MQSKKIIIKTTLQRDVAFNCPSRLATVILLIGLVISILVTILYSFSVSESKLVWNDYARSEIVVSDLDGSNQTSYRDLEHIVSPLRLAVYAPERAIFFASPYLDKILRLDLDEGAVSEILSTGPQFPVAESMLSAIAVNEDAKKIYWGESAHRAIYSANLDGSEREILIPDAGYVMDIFLDTNKSKIYWTDNTTDAERIVRSNLDGSEVEVVTTLGYGSPLALSVSPNNGDVYWADGYLKGITLQKVDSSGKHSKTVYDSDNGADGTLIDVSQSQLYWIEGAISGTQSIRRANLDGTNIVEIHIQSGGNMRDLEILPSPRPNGFIQASLFAVICIILFILTRRLYGGSKEE